MAKLGRKRIKLTPEEVEQLAAKGFSLKEAGLSLSDRMCLSAFYKKIKKQSELLAAWNKGRLHKLQPIMDALYTKALKGDVQAINMILRSATHYGAPDAHLQHDPLYMYEQSKKETENASKKTHTFIVEIPTPSE